MFRAVCPEDPPAWGGPKAPPSGAGWRLSRPSAGRGGERGYRAAPRPGRRLTPALTPPQRPCPARAPSPPPPGAERKGRRSPRTAPAATRTPSHRPAVRGARPLMPQVSRPPARARQDRAPGTPVGPRPARDWPGYLARARGGGEGGRPGMRVGPVGRLQRAIGRFSETGLHFQCNGTGGDGGESVASAVDSISVCGLVISAEIGRVSQWPVDFFFSRRNQCTVLIKWKVA